MKLSEFLDFMIIICIFRTKSIAAQDKTERRYACWGSFGPPVVSAQCPRHTVIHVISAGLKVQNQRGTCTYHESDCGCDFEDFGCQIPDVRSLCMGKSACRLDVTQQYISKASCRGFSDYMYIEFECIPEQTEHRRHVCAPGSFNNKVGFLTSPNYPNKYPSNQYCECALSTESDLNITVLDFHTNQHSCNGDRLVIGYNGQRITYCGNSKNKGEHIIPKGSTMKLIFDTDSKPGKGGFWMKYQAESLVQVSCSVEQKIVQTTTEVPKTESSMAKTTTNKKTTLLTTLITKEGLNPEKKTPKPLNHVSTPRTTPNPNPDNNSKETRPGDQWWWKFTVKENGQSKFLFSTPSVDGIDNAIDTFPRSQERPMRGDRPIAEMLTPRIPHSRNDPQNPNMTDPFQSIKDPNQGMDSLSEESVENSYSISDNYINSASIEASENLLHHAKSLNIPSNLLNDLSTAELKKLIEIYKDISPSEQSSEYVIPDYSDESYFTNFNSKNVNSFKSYPPHEHSPDTNMIPQYPNQQEDRKENSIDHLSGMGYSEEKMAMQDPDGKTSNKGFGGIDTPPTMATIIAACVIGSVLLIIVIGLIVKFVTKRSKARNNHRFHQRRKMNQQRRGNPHLARGMAGKTFA